MSIKQYYALVKWIGGDDDGKYSPDIPVEWIRDFDHRDLVEENCEPKPYIIEWRNTKKKPLAGWECYDAFVVKVSDRKPVLEKYFNMLGGQKSPHKMIISAASGTKAKIVIEPEQSNEMNGKQDGFDDDDDLLNSPRSSRTSSVSHQSSLSSKTSRQSSPLSKGLPKKNGDFAIKEKDVMRLSGIETLGESGDVMHNDIKKKQYRKEVASGVRGHENRMKRKIDLRSESEDIQLTNRNQDRDTDSDPRSIEHFNGLMKQMVEGNRSVQKTLNVVCKHLKQKSKKRRSSSSSSSSSSDSDEDKEQTRKIGPRGNRISVVLNHWRLAKMESTYTAMGTTLLVALFPLEVLLKSNLRGGRAKNKGNETHVRREALHKKTVDAIYHAVEERHPKKFNKTGLGIAINNKLTSLRRASKNTETETNAS